MYYIIHGAIRHLCLPSETHCYGLRPHLEPLGGLYVAVADRLTADTGRAAVFQPDLDTLPGIAQTQQQLHLAPTN